MSAFFCYPLVKSRGQPIYGAFGFWSIDSSSLDFYVHLKRRFFTLLRYGLRNCKKSIPYWKLDVVMIPFSYQQPCQIHFLTQIQFFAMLTRYWDVFKLRWSGFESHKWLTGSRSKMKLTSSLEVTSTIKCDFIKIPFFHLFRCRHVPRQKSAFYLVIWFNSWPPHVQIIPRFSQVKYKFYFHHAYCPCWL